MNDELISLKSEATNTVGNDPFIGEISMFAGNFAPRGWAFCQGQLLPISQNQALFSILGTIYGGDGRTTFGLPDLRGRVAISSGNGPGLSTRPLGQKGGQEQVTLNINQMPSHNHPITDIPVTGQITFPFTSDATAGSNISVVIPNKTSADGKNFQGVTSDLKANGTTANAGGSQPHNNMAPYTVINYIIALQGTYPSRS